MFEPQIGLNYLRMPMQPLLESFRGFDDVHSCEKVKIVSQRKDVKEHEGGIAEPNKKRGWWQAVEPPGDDKGTTVIAEPYLRVLVREKGRVLVDERFLLVRQIVNRLDRSGGADRNAGAAVDAAVGINIHLGRRLKTGFILLGMDAVRGADIDA